MSENGLSKVTGHNFHDFGVDANLALRPYDPQGDELVFQDAETIAALIGAYDAAEAEDDLLSFREEWEYTNALIRFDETVALRSSTAEVQRAFDQLMCAALGNAFGQDAIRDAEEVLEATRLQLHEKDLQKIVERPM